MSISVPSTLKRRMAEAMAEVNWSQTARQAFEKALAEIEALQGLDATGRLIGLGEWRWYVKA